MHLPRKLCLTVALLLTAGTAAPGQNQQSPTPKQTPNPSSAQGPSVRPPGRGFRSDHEPGPFGPRVLQQLNLTDTQREQIRTIIQQGFESTKAQRLELRQLGD